jgi:large subunit ribosomal protein L17
MRHRLAGRTFGRRSDQRKALFRGLATSLLDAERIETTLAKAKELRRVVEPLVTLAKRGDLHARRQAAAFIYKAEVVKKLFTEVAERFKTRAGGYTRIYQLGQRRGDGAKMALIELIPGEKKAKKTSKSDKTAKTEKSETAEKQAKAPSAKNKEAPAKAERKPAKPSKKAEKGA